MKNINGYIEIDGVISKVTSVDDLKQIVQSLGKDFTDLNEEEFRKLTCKYETGIGFVVDDCQVVYKNKFLVRAKNPLGEYKIPEGTYVVQRNAFYYKVQEKICVSDVNSLRFPRSIIAIGDSAFSCNEVKDIVWSDSIQYIGANTFSRCLEIKEKLVLPKDLRFLEASAFKYCQKITSVIFSDKIEAIGSHAFAKCTSLKSVYIPNSVKRVGNGIFDECRKLESIFIDTGSKERFAEFFPFLVDKLKEVKSIDNVEDFKK